MLGLLSWSEIETIALLKHIDYLGIMRPMQVVLFSKGAELVELVEKSNNIPFIS